jgi:hypothetical protein
MEAADERGNDVAIFGVIVVTLAVEIGGHDATVVHAVAIAVLAVVTFTQFDTSDFGDGIGLISRL